MATVPSGQIQQIDMYAALTKRGSAGETVAVCGTCGAIVARDHTDRHVAWHNTAHSSAQVVTNTQIPALDK